MSQEEKDGYMATQLIGMMIRSAREDSRDQDPAIRASADAWLSSKDSGLASLESGCRHMGSLCLGITAQQRSHIRDSLEVDIPDDSLTKPGTWRNIVMDPSITDGTVSAAVNQIAADSYPAIAPEMDTPDPEIGPDDTPSFPGSSDFSPSR